MRYPASNRSIEAGGGRCNIDGAGKAVADPDDQMRPPRPGLAVPLGKRRMFFPSVASPPERAYGFAGDAFGETKFGGHDRHIDLPLRNVQQGRLARRGPFGGYAGRLAPQTRQQMCKHGEHEIRRRDAEHPSRTGRIEDIARRKHALDSPQHRPCLFDQIECDGGRLHPHAAFDQQWIAQLAAQPRERVADRRLRPSQPLRGAADAPLRHQDLEHDQQIEVEPA